MGKAPGFLLRFLAAAVLSTGSVISIVQRRLTGQVDVLDEKHEP